MIDIILPHIINSGVYLDHISGLFSVIHAKFSATNMNVSDRGLIGIGAGTATTGMLGAGIGQGFSAGKAAEAIGRNPEAAPKIRTVFITGAAIAESGAIYALLVAIILLFVYK